MFSLKVSVILLLFPIETPSSAGELELNEGTLASTKTLVVEPTLFNVKLALLPAASLKVPPLEAKVPTAIPSVSLSPFCTVYLNNKALPPLPLI